MISILIYLPGSDITYMILFNALIGYIVQSFGVDPAFTNSLNFRLLVGIPATFALYLPLSILRDMIVF